jgi:hypothetical protein
MMLATTSAIAEVADVQTTKKDERAFEPPGRMCKRHRSAAAEPQPNSIRLKIT